MGNVDKANQQDRAGAAKQGIGADLAERNQGLTVLLVDIRAWTREALARAIESACRDLRVLRVADVADLASLDWQGRPAVVLLNATGLRLTDARVSGAVAAARACLPAVPVVALAENQELDDILGAIEAGLSGYTPVSLELHLVIEALRFVAAGGTFIPAGPILSSFDAAMFDDSRPEQFGGEAASARLGTDSAAVISLLNEMTPREFSVLDLLREGHSNKTIARELDISEATVKVHLRHIMRKLGATNRTQAALLAEQLMENLEPQELRGE